MNQTIQSYGVLGFWHHICNAYITSVLNFLLTCFVLGGGASFAVNWNFYYQLSFGLVWFGLVWFGLVLLPSGDFFFRLELVGYLGI